MDATIRVLLADDTPEIRMLLRATLEGDGRFSVTGEATDGAEAVDLARDHQPDAVILDLAMPVMDGLQAIPLIRKGSPATKIVILSGFDSGQMAEEAKGRGADAYFEKGRALDEVIETLSGFYPEVTHRAPTSEPSPSARVPAIDEPPTPILPAIEDLERADYEDHRLDVVLSTLIHELQTPVTVIQGFASTLQKAVDRMDQNSILAGAAAIGRSAGHLQTLIRSLTDVRAIDSGRLRLATEIVDLSDLLRQTLKDLTVVTDPHPVRLDTEEGVRARVDGIRIRQVLTNLLSNAAKFSPREEPIEVFVASSEEGPCFVVADHGPGIPPERMKLLFRKFSRLGSNEPGTGLGLYVSRGIVRAHGGDITITTRPGAGSRFEVRLPPLE